MTDRFPDIEIYIKRPALDDVIAWLDRRFSVKGTAQQGDTVMCMLEGFQCAIVEDAVKGGFTSVWFKSADTPWATDRDCALEAAREFGLEVRCSTGSWQEDDEGPEWLRITPEGESVVDWP